jgi:hypothetical protein
VGDVDLVVDTDVLIEALRGDNTARAWLATLEPRVLGIPVLVRMEILLGARDAREWRTLGEELDRYRILHLETGDSERARDWFDQFHLSHGIGIVDCLIAAIPFRLGTPFYTFNVKHFLVIPGLDARVPYPQSGLPAV